MADCLVEVTRDSVCMGDDVDAPHFLRLALPATVTLKDVFLMLAEKHYLPGIAGQHHYWEAWSAGKLLASFTGNSATPEHSACLIEKLAEHATDGKFGIEFKYYSATT